MFSGYVSLFCGGGAEGGGGGGGGGRWRCKINEITDALTKCT